MRRAALLVATLALAGCAQPSPATSARRDHVVFAFPDWCAARQPKRPWTDWDEARRREPTGNGVCGVRVAEETEVCVVLRDHRVAKLEVAVPDEGRKVLDAPVGDARLGAFQVPAREGAALVRLDGSLVVAEVAGLREAGPCFYW